VTLEYSKQSIGELPYQLWSALGRPHGSEEEDRLEAERQLAAAAAINADGGRRDSAIDTSLKESFPVSDLAASHIPDLPPILATKLSAPRKTVTLPLMSRMMVRRQQHGISEKDE
jgi:hypothetical protein